MITRSRGLFQSHRIQPRLQWPGLLGLSVLLGTMLSCQRREESPPVPAPSASAPQSGGVPAEPPKEQGSELDLPAALKASKLPVYELKMDPAALAGFEQSAFSNKTVPATFLADGVVFGQVQVRYRGAWSRTWPKKPVKIFFNKETPFQGEHCLNLNSGWRDPALVRECLAYHVFSACGVPAPQSQMVRLQLNGRFRGLYVQVQQPGKAFFQRLNLKGASLYKAVSRSNQADERELGSSEAYSRNYEKQNRKEEGYSDLEAFCRDLARSTNVLEFFSQRVDLDKYVRYLAATALTQDWDSFNKNHFLVYDGNGSKKWFAVPWDLDRTFGDHWNQTFGETRLSPLLGTRRMPGVTGWNRLEESFFREPQLEDRFWIRLTQLLETEFTPEKLFPLLDQLEASISPEATLDRQNWPAPVSSLHDGIARVKKFITARRAFLLGEIPPPVRSRIHREG